MDELRKTQNLWSRKLSAWMDERNAQKRIELYKEVKALENRIQQLKGKK